MTRIREKNYNVFGLLWGMEVVERHEIREEKVKERLCCDVPALSLLA